MRTYLHFTKPVGQHKMGTASVWDMPLSLCPYCGHECEADWVDIGVGNMQSQPYFCRHCGSCQIGTYDEYEHPSSDERLTGWYEPNKEFII